MSDLTDSEFRTLLDWMMVSDPWPLQGEDEERMKDLLNREADKRGHSSWVKAYHEVGQ